MRLTIDPKADALYLRLNEEQIVDSEKIAAGVVLDYDAQDNVVGVEMLNLSKRGNPVDIEKLVFETLKPHETEVVVRETPPPYGNATEK
jgi:uncharacterized protein YuzE